MIYFLAINKTYWKLGLKIYVLHQEFILLHITILAILY